MTGHHMKLLRLTAACAVVNALLNFFLARPFGGYGVATATAITLVGFNLVVVRAARRRRGAHFRLFRAGRVAPGLLADRDRRRQASALDMTDLFAIGGEQRAALRAQPEWTSFRSALVVRIVGGEVERVLEYTSPPEHRPDDLPSHVFKAATIEGDTAYLCTQTEVLICDFPSFAIRRVVSHPCFNDLHHVTPAPDGSLYVAVTGLDAVAELSPEGELGGWSGCWARIPGSASRPTSTTARCRRPSPTTRIPTTSSFPTARAGRG